MAMIGNPIVSTDFPVDYKSGNGSTTAFTLSVAPASVNSIDVQISGVSQSPQTYSVSGTTLTFSAAPPTGTNNIVVRHLGVAGIPNTPSAGSVVTASFASGAITSGLLPTGTVLQVVNATYSTATSSTTSTYVDTGLTATITPKFSTSKILVLISQAGCYKTSANVTNGVYLRLVRNSTSINTFAVALSYTGTATENITMASTCYLDSPATTSATVYKSQYASYSNASAAYVQANNDTSTITLMEIAG